MNEAIKKHRIVLVIALGLIICGSLLGGWIQRGAGKAIIKNVRYTGPNAFVYSARLYVPKGVTNKNPAPGAFVIHGGDAQNEIMGNVAVELTRRGIVVLSIDQPGAGYSDPPSFSMGMGGADGLRYLRSLDIVDTKNIGLVGMSMGGDALGSAVKAFPDGYKAVACLDSKVGLGPGKEIDIPVHNVMVTWGLLEEHTPFFWRVPFPKDMPDSKVLKSFLGVTERVQPGKLYGSIEDGTAGMLRFTQDTHLTNMDSNEAIGNVIEWFQMTLKGVKEIPASNQIWVWKVVGTFAAFIGLMLFLFPVGALLLETNYFKSIGEAVPEYKGLKGTGWWIGALLTTILAPLTYVWARNTMGQKVLVPNSLWPQSQINRYYLGWIIILGVISIIIGLITHFAVTRKSGATGVNYGLTWAGKGMDWSKIGKSLLLAFYILIPAYLIVLAAYNMLDVDFRLNFLAIRAMSFLRFRIFLGYVIPFVFFYLILAFMLHGFLRAKNGAMTIGREMIVNALILIAGMIIWMAIQYIATFSSGAPLLGADTNLTIRALPLLIIWFALGMTSTYFFRKTGHIYVSGFLMGLFVTWYVVANSMISVVP
jgi:pimeloyl-ACP methyl ester carboxylesterase